LPWRHRKTARRNRPSDRKARRRRPRPSADGTAPSSGSGRRFGPSRLVVTAKRAPSEGDSQAKRPLKARPRGMREGMESNVKFTAGEPLEFPSSGRPGKIETVATKPMATQRDLSLAYSPGVAVPVEAIAADPGKAYDLTAKGNLVAV